MNFQDVPNSIFSNVCVKQYEYVSSSLTTSTEICNGPLNSFGSLFVVLFLVGIFGYGLYRLIK